MLCRLLTCIKRSYFMQRYVRGHHNRYYRQGIINIQYLPLYQAKLYSSSTFDERFSFLILMNLIRFKKEGSRINRSLDHMIDNINNIKQFVTVASILREVADNPDVDMKKVGVLVRRGQQCFVESSRNRERNPLDASADIYRNLDGGIMAQFLGCASDCGYAKQVFNNKDFNEELIKRFQTFSHRFLYQIIEMSYSLGAKDVYKGCLNELLFLEPLLGDDDLTTIKSFDLLDRIKDPEFHALTRRVEERRASMSS